MRRIAYDIHVHSCLSPCGDNDMTPCNIAGMAHLNGLELVALTDHNTTGNCPAFEKACAEYGIETLCGMELTTAEEIHLMCIFADAKQAARFEEAVLPYRMKVKNRKEIFGEQLILNERDEVIGEEPYLLPIATGLGLEDAASLVWEHGGVAYPAHIERESNGILSVLGALPQKPAFETVECVNTAEFAQLNKRKVVSSDAHRLWELKDSSNTVLIGDEGTIKEAMMAYLGGL
ncbi:MAG: PHP domain-containing protein [Eubacteriales bacterium]|nr:PHP domain-containing protein [Eubacteriales bacterium]